MTILPALANMHLNYAASSIFEFTNMCVWSLYPDPRHLPGTVIGNSDTGPKTVTLVVFVALQTR